ncbi:hypothetical protein [Rhodanobacter sp. L36]|uniref:hypothetical protein n=1 Tax=Rhodanobacter sp. L36 TaxID=1747221 RepID=UPI00131C2C67|nr:hypothetical protein [Rhodanobacter sp. L36]
MNTDPSFLSDATDPAAGAVQSVTGSDSKPASMLDQAAAGLSGKAPDAGLQANAPYINGDPIDDGAADPPTLAAQPQAHGSDNDKPSNYNGVDKPLPIQFIHYDTLHDGLSDKFSGDAPSRGVAMRDALLREVVLMSSFAQGARQVMVQHGESGALGQAVAAIGSLLGGSSSAPAGPEQFDPVIQKLTAVSASINKSPVLYKDINDAGRKLHDARNAYETVCTSALKTGGGGGGGLPSLPALPTIPGVGGPAGIVSKLPGWLFKVQDAYLSTFAAVRGVCEKPITRACHDFSFAAAKAIPNPCYEIWFSTSSGKPASKGAAPAPAPAPAPKESTLDKIAALPGEAQKAQDSATDWLQTDGGAASGPKQSALDAAFSALAGDPKKPSPTDLTSVMCAGLAKGIGFDDGKFPAPLDKVVARMAAAALSIMQKTYTGILASDGDLSPFDAAGNPGMTKVQDCVHDAVHSTMATLIVDEVWSLVGLNADGPGKNAANHGSLGSMQIGADQLENKAAEMINKELAKQAHYLDAITDFVTHDLTEALQKAAKGSSGSDALTMETYLGRMPLALALLMRDLVFPLFNLVLKLFGFSDKLGVIWDPVAKGLSKAGDVVNQAKADKDRVNQGADNAKQQAKTLDHDIGEISSLSGGTDVAADQKAAQKVGTLGNDVSNTPDKVAGKDAKGDSGWQPPDENPKDTQDAKPLDATRNKGGTAQKPPPDDIKSVGYLTAPPPKA